VSVAQGVDNYEFRYNGLGNRVVQNTPGSEINYTLDPSTSLRAGLNAGLTQVLADGTNAYLYGMGRIGEEQPGGWQYHLGDALGSVRQLADPASASTLANRYQPFGHPLANMGVASSVFNFAGEQKDNTSLLFLRERYLSTNLGRFLTLDSLPGIEGTAPQALRHTREGGCPVLARAHPSGFPHHSAHLHPLAPPARAGVRYAQRGASVASGVFDLRGNDSSCVTPPGPYHILLFGISSRGFPTSGE
jgi:hypothetical protein